MRLSCLAIWALLLSAVNAMAEGTTPGPAGEPSGVWREQIHWAPMRDASGAQRLLYTRICRPTGDTPARVVLINHGTPPDPNARPTMKPASCTNEAVQWFLTRGYIVVLGMRRGYGETGGSYDESNGSLCPAQAYVQSGLEGARDIAALLAYATALPFARRDGVVIVGQSAGGWAADAYDSQPHPQVVALVSMAGGRGGHLNNTPSNNCRPDQLAQAASVYGKTASTPMLWIYAANDSYFAPAIVAALYAAFTQAGGKAELYQLDPFGTDGHSLFFGRGGSAIWGPLMERYLAARDAAAGLSAR